MQFTKHQTAVLSKIALAVTIVAIFLVSSVGSLQASAATTISQQRVGAMNAPVFTHKLSCRPDPGDGLEYLELPPPRSEFLPGRGRGAGDGLQRPRAGGLSIHQSGRRLVSVPGAQGPNVDQYGRWIINATHFPSVGGENGIKALADYVHGLGLKFGIYETAGISEQAVKENTKVLGTKYTADEIATKVPQNNYNCGGMVDVNYAKPGAQAYVNSIVSELASWGVDYIKLDGITNHNVPDIRAWSIAIVQSGRPMVLDTTQGSFTIQIAPQLVKYSNQWEFKPDIEINGPDEGSAPSCSIPPFTGCLSVFPLSSYSHWSDRFDAVANWQPFGGPGGFNDYDSIQVGDGPANAGMSFAGEQSELSLWALGSSPLILGVDLTSEVTNAYGTSSSSPPGRSRSPFEPPSYPGGSRRD